MNAQTYWGIKKFYTFIVANFFGIIFLMLVLGFMGPVMAGPPVGGEVYFYDVAQEEFKVVWQVDTPSTSCTVNVYDQGGNPLSPPITPITDGSPVLQARGIMVVRVYNLQENTKYLVQTISTDSQSVVHTYPESAEPGTLLEVTTEKTISTPADWENGRLYFAIYGPDGITGDPTQNIIPDPNDVIVLVGTEGANYPFRATPFEFVGTGIYGFRLNCKLFITRDTSNNSKWLNWTTDTNDHPITIRILGGVTPTDGLGYKTISETFYNADEGTAPCLVNGGSSGIVSCIGSDSNFINQLELTPNQGPQFDLNPNQTVNKNQLLTINICATDPEGDTVAGFSLSGKPSGMDIVTDANCATITWTPTECGTFENINVTATDDQGNFSVKTFKVDILICPPYQPGGSIDPQAPVTSNDLTCIAVSNGDPDGDTPITFIYAWYDVSNTGNILSTTDTLGSALTSKGNEYACEVKATDNKHGNSDSFIAGPVEVINSPPLAPGSAVITPGAPETDDPLTCTITAATDPDPEDAGLIKYVYRWTCTNCDDTTPVDHDNITILTDTWLSTTTDKNEQWTCEVWATDGTAPGPSITSNTVTIANKPPSTPGDVQITNPPVYTDDDLTCTVGTPSTDPDEGDAVYYVFRWNCTNCGKDPITRDPKLSTTYNSDTLEDTNTAKNEHWSCDVWAQDETGQIMSSSATTSSVTILNSPPENLSAQVDPDPAYDANDLICTASGVIDADGDDISYTYQWNCTDCGGKTVEPRTSSATSDTLLASDTAQGEKWSCDVTAKDTSNDQDSDTSNQVLIDNRPPVITTDPAEPHIWDEQESYTIQINVTDPDGNLFTLEYDDANSLDLSDPNVSGWLSYDSVYRILSAEPPSGSSSLDLGYGVGILKFKFIVEETDGTPNERVEESVTATIRFPAITVDDFEYPANKPTLENNNWYKLQGSGSKLLKVVEDDPNNHYLKTTVTGTPTNNSQINYIIYKNIPTSSPYTNAYPKILFSVNDKNLYYFDAFVKAKNNAGNEKNYFLRYIPRDPNTHENKVSGSYVIYNIGEESLDPNGTGKITDVERDMDKDLFNATGYHYLLLMGIVLRGDIDYMDDIKVRSTPPSAPLKDVENFTAQGSENQVILTWTLPQNQADNVAGYNIYMDTNEVPAKVPALKIANLTPDKTSYTKTGLTNDVTYCFRITVIDNLLIPNETEGVTDCTETIIEAPLAPIDLEASQQDSTIVLTWGNPLDQHPDLAGYMIYYCDCVTGDCSTCYSEFVAANKADSTGGFTHYITRDATQEFLQYGETYDFTVKAKDTAQPANLSGGSSLSITLVYPTTKLIDNFDIGYLEGQTLIQRGWYRLQGKGTFMRKLRDSDNYYLEVKGPADYMVVKWLKNPTDFKNPNLSMSIRSSGDFRIDAYVRGKDGKNYFLSYKGDKNTEEDSPDAIVEQKRFFVYKIGWKNKVSTEWYDIQRDLDDDLSKAKGVEFDMMLGFILRGTLDIDNVELGEGIPEAENLTARPGDSSVLLSWTIADPSKIDETKIYVDTNLMHTITVSSGQNDYEVTGLTNNTEYEFRLVQVAEGEESQGVSVSATPMIYKTPFFTFDNEADLNEWSLSVTTGVVRSLEYAPGVQSNVMYLNPSGAYPDRYYVANKGIDISDVTGMTCRVKTSTNFVIWLQLVDTLNNPFMLGFVPGGTKGNHSSFGFFGYYFLGPGLTDGKWHLLDLPLDDVMASIFPDIDNIGVNMINSIYIGGRIYVDDVFIY